MSNNIPIEIENSPNTPLTAKDEAELRRRVDEFLHDKNQSAQEGTPTQPSEEKSSVEIPPETDFKDVDSAAITEALVAAEDVAIEEEEKITFFKTMVADQPFRMTVRLFNGKFAVDIRSRCLLEQKRIFEVLADDQKRNIIPEGDVALFVTRMQYYLAALMIERINGARFSEITLSPGNTFANDAETLRTFVNQNIETMTGIRWTAILNALRIFEAKCAKMGKMAANGDFWKPLV